LAHIGFAEGMLAIRDMLGEDPMPIDYANVPWCIYCHPEVSFVGHTEKSAKEAGFDVIVSKHRYSGNGRALILGEPEGMVKIIAEKRSDGTGGRLLGVHMVGPWVTEQLGQAYLAVNWEADVDDVAAFIQPHPTLSELFGESVLALTGRSLHG
jgi:dihydrolipoamide dehydrogenase